MRPPTASQRLAADPDVLGDRHRGHQIQFLVDHRGAPANSDAAGVRPVQASDDLHQRGLARAIFSHQRVHRPRPHMHRNAVQRDRAGKGLSHAIHFE